MQEILHRGPALFTKAQIHRRGHKNHIFLLFSAAFAGAIINLDRGTVKNQAGHAE